MDKPPMEASQQFAWALYTLRRGCALWIPEPDKESTSHYRQNGIHVGDVGILRADGSFDFVFNVCCSANDPINLYGVPTDFQTLSWDGPKRRIDNIFRPGEPVLSRGAEKRVLGVEAEGTYSVPGNVPLNGGAGLSISFATDRGAVIFPANGVDSVDCQDITIFRNYAERHAVNWYRFMNKTLAMEVENGAIYFITGFDKTNCWENAVFSIKERTCQVIINTDRSSAGSDRFRLSDPSLHDTFSSRCSPPDNVHHNQTLFIRGFRISMPHRSGVQRTRTCKASLKDVSGKNTHFSLNHGTPPSPGSEVSTASSWSKISSSIISSSGYIDPLNEVGSAYAWVDGNASQELGDLPPSSELQLCHSLKAINDYILRNVEARDDIKVVITHDENWIALVKEEDIEMPDEPTLLKRLLELYQITVKEGCAYLDRIEARNESYHSCKATPITTGNGDISNSKVPAPDVQQPLVQCPLPNSEPGVDASSKKPEVLSNPQTLTDKFIHNALRSEHPFELVEPVLLSVPVPPETSTGNACTSLPDVVTDGTSASLKPKPDVSSLPTVPAKLLVLSAKDVCIECFKKDDGQMADDVDVLSPPKIWDGLQSDPEVVEGPKRGELLDKEEASTRVDNTKKIIFKSQAASVWELTEQNIELWLTMHSRESDLGHQIVESYIQSQREFNNDLRSEPTLGVLLPWEPDPATRAGEDGLALAVTDKPEVFPRRPSLPAKPAILSNNPPPTAEGPCLECIERDRGMVDVDVTSPSAWDRESDQDFLEEIKRNDEEAIGVEVSSNKLRSFGQQLTEQNIKLWLGVNPQERKPRQHMVNSYIQSQRTLVEECSDGYKGMVESDEEGFARQNGFLDTETLPFDSSLPPPYSSLYPFGQPNSEARAVTQAEVSQGIASMMPTFPCRVPGCSLLGEACFTTNHTYHTRSSESPEVDQEISQLSPRP